MAGLSPGHMENAFVLMAGRHHEPLTRSEALLHHPNALPASGRRFIRHIEEISKPGEGVCEGMSDLDTIQVPPRERSQRDRRMLLFQFTDTLLHRAQKKIRPTGKVIGIRIELRDLCRQKLA